MRTRCLRGNLVGSLTLLSGLAALGDASKAHAAGIEDLVGGAESTGRAAAIGHAADFMATAHHPANLAVLHGAEAGVELRLPILQACYDRARDPRVPYREPDPSLEFEGYEHFSKVCNEADPMLAANIGWAHRVSKRLGYGIGIFTPAGVGQTKYGTDTVVSVLPHPDDPYEPTRTGVQSPTRQMGIERRGVNAFLMAGLGVSLTDWLRVGGSLGYGVASVYSKSVVSAMGGSFKDQEVITEIRAHSWFVPKAVLSLTLAPVQQVEIFGVLTYHGDIRAKGTADLTANGISGAPLRSCREENPGTHCRIDGVEVTVPFPAIEALGGVRFAKLRRNRDGVLDPMRDEVFDLELQAIWTQTSDVDVFDVKLHGQDPNVDPTTPRIQWNNLYDGSVGAYVRQQSGVPKYWRNTLSLRAGGDVQLVPEHFAVRAGVSYATSAVDPEYMNLDYWPVEKIGIHAGATVAAGRFKITAGYAHFMYATVDVPVGRGRVKDIATANEEAANAVNEGTFRAAQNVFSLQVNAAF
jgi:hypothetical protein